MRLIRFGEAGKEKPGIEVEGIRYDASEIFDDWNPAFFADGSLARLMEVDPGTLPKVDASVRLGPPVDRPGKVLCIGLNYRDHAEESGMAEPDMPILFFKGANSVVGPNDDIQIPRGSNMTDWEVELAVIIGKETRYLSSPEDAKSVVAGYATANDVSEREFQLQRSGAQWGKGKSCDTFNPLGPYLVTADEVGDPHDLAMSLSVNGETMQDGNTGNMIFNVWDIIYDLSQYMTLEPGDLINTGTPAGVGMGMKPPKFLKAGDELVTRIEGLGEQRQICVQA